MDGTTRQSGGRPTRERAAAIDDRVLDGARSVFCRKGVANSSLEEIAFGLGISKHTIYRRYPNKLALLDAVVARDIHRFREALSASAGEGSDPLDALRRTAWRYVEIGSSRDYASFYLSVGAEAAFSHPVRERLGEWSSVALEPLTDAVAAAQSEGSIRPGDPSAICEILVDLLEGVNNRVRLGRDASADGPAPRQLFDRRWDVFMSAMAGG